MPQQQNTSVVALQLEKVRTRLPQLYERDNALLNMIQQRGDVEMVSSRNMRIPVQIRPGGKFGQVNMDGGDLGRGSGTRYQPAQVSPISFRFATEISKLVEYVTNSGEKAIANAVEREIIQSMAQFRNVLDRYLMTAGDAVIGEVATGGVSGNTLTLTDPHRADLMYFNQDVAIYSSDLATKRGESDITSIDYDSGEITLSALPSGTVAGDKVLISGVAGSNPVGIYGIKYHQSNAASGMWLNLNRATYPELRTPRVNANNSALTTGPIRLALNKLRKALGANIVQEKRLIACLNVEQEDAYEQLGIVISEIIKDSSARQGMDLFFNGPKTMASVPMYPNVHADPLRIDFLALEHWGRAVSKEIDFYEVDGNRIFPLYNTTSGGVEAAFVYYYVTTFQVFTDNPRCGAYIDGLIRPSGY